MTVSTGHRAVVIGDGIIGLTTAFYLTQRGVQTTILAPSLTGAASPASAGMLAPSVERTQGPAQAFGEAARDAWDRLSVILRTQGRRAIHLERRGILRLARTSDEAQALKTRLKLDDHWLPPDDAHALQPGVNCECGAALYAGDGVVDAPAALSSLAEALRQSSLATFTDEAATLVRPGRRDCVVVGARGSTLQADAVVIAAGAWSPAIAGVPRELPIQPVRGTLLAFGGIQLSRPVYATDSHAYAIPRGDHVLVGATSDDVGFDASPSERDIDRLSEMARVLFTNADELPRLGTVTGCGQ